MDFESFVTFLKNHLPNKPCDGEEPEERHLMRFLTFLGACLAVESLSLAGIVFVSFDPTIVLGILDQATPLFLLVIFGLILLVPVGVGLPITRNPAREKSSYCHMVHLGTRYGLIGMALLLGARGIFA